ncbi:MAG: LysM peptidoglycan-binding domain-containing protein [Caldilineaceae bacterium]
MDDLKNHPDVTGPSPAGVPPQARSLGSRRCPNCGNQVSAHTSVCPACGEGLKDRSDRVRCRYCGERSSAELTVCPFCGRELKSAPPRAFTWGIPIGLVALVMVLLIGQVSAGRNPLAWAEARFSVEGQPAGDQVGKGLVVVVTPAAAQADAATNQAVADSQAGTESQADVLVQTDVAVDPAPNVETVAEAAPGGDAQAITAPESASEVVPAAEVANSNEAAQLNQTATEEPAGGAAETVPVSNAAVALSAVAAQSAQPADASVAQAAPEPEETVAESDVSAQAQGPIVSAAGAGANSGLPTSTPTSTGTATPVSTPTPSPTSTTVATATPVPTETPTPAPMPTYEIQRGDTLIVIAKKNDVRVDDLMSVNDISAADAFSIQPGQKLLIPLEGTVNSAGSGPTATPEEVEVIAPTNTPMPTPTTPSLRLDAPILRSPEPGTPVSCSSPAALAWLPVPFMRAEDRFVLHLGFVSGKMDDGREVVIWVLEQPFPSSATSWDMDGSLCSLAPQEYNRKWHWYVEVVEDVEGALRPVSPASQTWDFTWN